MDRRSITCFRRPAVPSVCTERTISRCRSRDTGESPADSCLMLIFGSGLSFSAGTLQTPCEEDELHKRTKNLVGCHHSHVCYQQESGNGYASGNENYGLKFRSAAWLLQSSDHRRTDCVLSFTNTSPAIHVPAECMRQAPSS